MDITIEFLPGEHIAKAAQKLVNEANSCGGMVKADFNGVEIFAVPATSPDDIVQHYNDECDRRSKAYRESPEGIAAAEQNRREIAALQAKCDRMAMALPGLDFADLNAILAWLVEFQSASDRTGVEVPRRQIVETFAHHGFMPDVNLDGDFRPDDRENVARYIIGQAMDNLTRVGAVHPIVEKFVGEWREKFERSA